MIVTASTTLLAQKNIEEVSGSICDQLSNKKGFYDFRFGMSIDSCKTIVDRLSFNSSEYWKSRAKSGEDSMAVVRYNEYKPELMPLGSIYYLKNDSVIKYRLQTTWTKRYNTFYDTEIESLDLFFYKNELFKIVFNLSKLTDNRHFIDTLASKLGDTEISCDAVKEKHYIDVILLQRTSDNPDLCDDNFYICTTERPNKKNSYQPECMKAIYCESTHNTFFASFCEMGLQCGRKKKKFLMYIESPTIRQQIIDEFNVDDW